MTVRPNARLTPKKPMPRAGKPAASTALPQPAKVNQNVPRNSAPRRRGISIRSPLQHSLTQPDRIGGYRTGKGQPGVTERFYNLSAVGGGGYGQSQVSRVGSTHTRRARHVRFTSIASELWHRSDQGISVWRRA